MAVFYQAPDGYARRPRAPRRRREPVARHSEQPGQVSMAEVTRTADRAAAMAAGQCPDCHAPKGQPCTRAPRPGEGTGRVELGYMCHVARHELVESTQDADGTIAS